MIGYELFLVSQPGETWMVTKTCKEHKNPDWTGKPFTRMPGDIHPCTNGCLYEQVLETIETPAQTFAFETDPMTIGVLQGIIATRWGSATYLAGVNHQSHAALHLMKALGKITAYLEQAEHVAVREEVTTISPQLADLVICAARLADLLNLDLETVVAARIAVKFSPQGA